MKEEKKEKFGRERSKGMNEIAKTLFAPIYPAIAERIVAECGITSGRCLDLGAGPASLSIAMATAAPELEVFAFDFSPDAQEIAERNIREAGLSGRVHCLCGDVHDIPLGDGFADLIISRGSLFFWDDPGQAFSECRRVLAPGGKTWIGGGFGSRELRDHIVPEMIRRDPEWENFYKNNMSRQQDGDFEEFLDEYTDCEYRIVHDDSGFWIMLHKKE